MANDSSTRIVRVNLPASMAEFIVDRVAAEDYDSPGEYIRSLIRADQKRHAKSQLETALMHAIEEDESSELTPEAVEQIQKKLRGDALRLD